MKKVIIIGASGSLAQYVIEALQTLNNVVLTLFARSGIARGLSEGNSIVKADVIDYDKLKNAISGQDIVYVNLAGNLEAMAKNIVRAMKETGVKRITAISSIGIYPSVGASIRLWLPEN